MGGGGGTADDLRVGNPVPAVTGTTLDGSAFDLAGLRGRPVILNFWGPSCIPCREEFPLFGAALGRHAADGLAIVGVLYLDEPDGARAFAAEYGGTWPTVVDPTRTIAKAYKVAARPQTYFIDRAGILRSIQIGGLTEADLERQIAAISGS